MLLDLLSATIRAIGYLIGLAGLIFFVYSFGFKYNVVKNRLKLKRENQLKNYETRIRNTLFFRWFDRLLQATNKSYSPMLFTRIARIQLISFLVLLFLLSITTHAFLYALVTSIIFIYISPAAFLYVRVVRMRSHSQADLSNTTIMLLQEYQRNSKNMMFALKELTKRLDGDTKLIFGMLFIRMENRTMDRDQVAEVFAYQIGEWGQNLSMTILKAIEEGTDVESILEDISADITEFLKSTSEAESSGREIAQLGKLTIFFIPTLIVINAQFFMEQNAYVYHFSDPVGIKVLTFSIILAFVGFIMAVLLEKPKKRL